MNHSGKVSGGGYVVQDSWWFSSLCGLHLLRFPNQLSWRNIAQGVRAGGIWQNAGKLKEWNELIGLRVPHFCLVSELNYPLPPPRFNIAPEKWWLEDYFPIGKVTFQRRAVKLREGSVTLTSLEWLQRNSYKLQPEALAHLSRNHWEVQKKHCQPAYYLSLVSLNKAVSNPYFWWG